MGFMPIERTKRVPTRGSKAQQTTLRINAEVKDALSQKAEEYNVSFSYLVSSFCAEKLDIPGYELPEKKVNT